jgi:hypothetical protein
MHAFVHQVHFLRLLIHFKTNFSTPDLKVIRVKIAMCLYKAPIHASQDPVKTAEHAIR